MTLRAISARAVVGAVLFLALGGPAPGAVGSCSDSSVTCTRSETTTFPDPGGCQVAFCVARLHAICARQAAGAMVDPLDMHTECADAATMDDSISRICLSAGSPFGLCADPSDLAAQACVDALYERGNYPQAPDDVDACANVRKCGGS